MNDLNSPPFHFENVINETSLPCHWRPKNYVKFEARSAFLAPRNNSRKLHAIKTSLEHKRNTITVRGISIQISTSSTDLYGIRSTDPSSWNNVNKAVRERARRLVSSNSNVPLMNLTTWSETTLRILTNPGPWSYSSMRRVHGFVFACRIVEY